MSLLDREDKTICAIATAPGRGGLSVIRVSGPQASEISRKLCSFLPKNLESHRLYYGDLSSLKTQDILDEVVVSFFAQARSFTGDETVEISCHGSPVLSKQIISELLSAGALLAEKGEFTYRAFSNGRIDLVQAESVLNLIESNTKKAAKNALRQLKGELSKSFLELQEKLTLILAHIEANIDFAAEDIVIESNKALLDKTEAVSKKMSKLIESYKKGKRINEGIHIALIGQPNVGKSSLLNNLINEDKAIVTATPGTTRDVVEASFDHEGMPFHFSDTAGLRETTDQIEHIGIQKSLERASQTDIVFFLVDISNIIREDLLYLKQFENEEIYIIGNKEDKLEDQIDLKDELLRKSKEFDVKIESLDSLKESYFISISVEKNQGIDEIKKVLTDLAQDNFSEESVVIVQQRHYINLSEANESLKAAINLLKENESPDFIAFELHVALKKIYEILGQEYEDQVMDKVFTEFCLGK